MNWVLETFISKPQKEKKDICFMNCNFYLVMKFVRLYKSNYKWIKSQTKYWKVTHLIHVEKWEQLNYVTRQSIA